MNIYDLLAEIKEVAKKNNLSPPFLVGGVPRDRVIGLSDKKIKDVDITTGNEDSKKLAILLASKLKDAKHRTYDDGHSSIDILGLRVDFSKNINVKNIDNILTTMGVETITPMKRELFSRDFTINCLLEDLEFKSIYDITTEGISDIKAKLIKCPISSDITIQSDPRRILRAIYFALKYNFLIEDSLKRSILKFRYDLKKLPLKFVQTKLHDILKINEEKGLDMLIEYKLLPIVELNQPIYDILIKNKQLMRTL